MTWTDTFLDPHLARFLRQHGLRTDGRSDRPLPGQVVVQEPTRQVIRLDLAHGGAYYLKWSRQEKPSRMLAMACRLCRPMSAALREVTLLQHLRTAGMPAARPVGWGERRVMGLPTAGFLVTEAIGGPSLDQAIAQADAQAQRHLWTQLGQLMGRLHHRGFFHIVRLKDVIVAHQPPRHETLWQAGDLVLIDREVALPRPRWFTRKRCFHGLARCLAKLERAGDSLAPAHLVAFARAYGQEVAPRLKLRPRELVHQVGRFMQSIQRHRRYRPAGSKSS